MHRCEPFRESTLTTIRFHDLRAHERPARRGAALPLAVAILLALPLALACAQRGRAPSPPAPRVDPGQVGIASFYSPKLAGRQTASGERYDPQAFTAAHRSLPFGSLVRVERVDSKGEGTDRFVDVRINDRGPFVRGRIIDLSGAAANQLGMRKSGVVKVRVQVIASP